MWLSLILSCWGAIKVLKPQPTKNKVGSSLSWLPLPSFGAVSLDLCLPRAITCSEQFFCFVFLFFPWWPNTERHVAKAASSLAANGSGPAWFGWCSILHLSSQAYWERKGEELFVFLEEEESGSPASFNMAGILIAEDTCSPPAAQGAK